MIKFENPVDIQFTSEEGEVKIYLQSDFIEYVTGILSKVTYDTVKDCYGKPFDKYVDVVEIYEITSIQFNDGTLKEMRRKDG